MLLVHGINEHSGRYRHVGQHFASKGYDVLAYDLRGHGQSGGRRGYVDSFSQYLDDLEDLVIERRQLGLPVVVVAHSMGGLIASTYLVQGRQAPDYLVLSAPALGANLALWQKVSAPVLSVVAPKFQVKSPINPSRLTRDEDAQQAYRDDPLRVKGTTGRLAHELFTTMQKTSQAIDRIALPAYVLHGSADQVVPQEWSAPLASLPNVTYRVWDQLRHECFNEPEWLEVVGEISGWLDQQLART